MPLHVFATLILSVIALAGVSIALAVAAGVNLMWLGLVALVAAGAIRWVKW